MSKTPAQSVDAALDAYREATVAGCAGDCQSFMTAKLAAADAVKVAMQAKDPTLYASPIGFVNAADSQADQVGRDNLGSESSTLAVGQPIQKMVAWFREHPEG